MVAASTGNHGRALAYAARLEGVRAVICMSRLVPENKVAEIDRLGADIRIVGNSQDDAQDEVDRLVPVLREAMEGALPLSVPLTVEVKVGDSWEGMTPVSRRDAGLAEAGEAPVEAAG